MNFALLLSLAPGLGPAPSLPEGAPPAGQTEAAYYVYVAAESEDVVALTRFDSGSKELEVLDRIEVGYQATEIEGPHGLTVAPEGDYWYLSLAHGKPNGWLYKYSTETNEFVAKCELGLFPATMQISPATGLLYCVNFNLHGSMEPSSVSIVDPRRWWRSSAWSPARCPTAPVSRPTACSTTPAR